MNKVSMDYRQELEAVRIVKYLLKEIQLMIFSNPNKI